MHRRHHFGQGHVFDVALDDLLTVLPVAPIEIVVVLQVDTHQPARVAIASISQRGTFSLAEKVAQKQRGTFERSRW